MAAGRLTVLSLVLATAASGGAIYNVSEVEVPLPEGGFGAVPTAISSNGIVAGRLLKDSGYTTQAFIYNPASGGAQYLTVGGYFFKNSGSVQSVNSSGVAASPFTLYSETYQAWVEGVVRFDGSSSSYLTSYPDTVGLSALIDEAGDVAFNMTGSAIVWKSDGSTVPIEGFAYTISPAGILGYNKDGAPYQYQDGVSTQLLGNNPVIAINSHGVALRGWGSTCGYGPPDGPVVDLGTLGGSSSNCIGLSAAGAVVGLSYDAEGNYLPFIYSGGTMTALNSALATSGYSVSNPIAMSDSGLILASGINLSTGLSDYLILSPSNETAIPEPATAVLLGGAFLVLAVRTRIRT